MSPDVNPDTGQTLWQLSNLLIALGVLAWVGFGVIWAWSGARPPLGLYLAWHLGGVLPGGGLKLWLRIRRGS